MKMAWYVPATQPGCKPCSVIFKMSLVGIVWPLGSKTGQTSKIRRDSENLVILGHTPKLPKIIDRRNVQVEFFHRFGFLFSFHDLFPFVPALPFCSLLLSLRSNSYSFRFTSFIGLFSCSFRCASSIPSVTSFLSVHDSFPFVLSFVPVVSIPSSVGSPIRIVPALPFGSLLFSFRFNSRPLRFHSFIDWFCSSFRCKSSVPFFFSGRYFFLFLLTLIFFEHPPWLRYAFLPS